MPQRDKITRISPQICKLGTTSSIQHSTFRPTYQTPHVSVGLHPGHIPAGAVVVDVAHPVRHVEVGHVAVTVVVGVWEQKTGRGGHVAVTVFKTTQFGWMHTVVVLGGAGVGHGGVVVVVIVLGQDVEVVEVVLAGRASATERKLWSLVSISW